MRTHKLMVLMLLLASLVMLPGPVGAIHLTIVHSVASVGTGSGQVLAARVATGPSFNIGTRHLLILVNDSDTNIWCTLDGSTAVVDTGTLLNAAGGALTLDVNPPDNAINCISSGSSKKLLVTEGF